MVPCRCPKCPPNGDDNGWQEEIVMSMEWEFELGDGDGIGDRGWG